MSNCRMGVDGSDVYAYHDVEGGWTIWAGADFYREYTAEDFNQRLNKMRESGLTVPDYAFEK